jgi:hypothetical protein
MYLELENATLQELLSALDDNDTERCNMQWEIAMCEKRLRQLLHERTTVIRAIDEFHAGYQGHDGPK